MPYEAKNFENLLGTPGLSDQLLKNHFTLYQGYVTNANKLMESLKDMATGNKVTAPEYAELKRRFGWEWNGMRLHEYYFGNLKKGGSALNQDENLFKKITEDFGSIKEWEKDFKATGSMRGIGWAILYHDPEAKKLLNVWINEHNVNHLAGSKPILVMDVFEHAYMIDYGVKKADYIEAFFKAIDWKAARKRFSE